MPELKYLKNRSRILNGNTLFTILEYKIFIFCLVCFQKDCQLNLAKISLILKVTNGPIFWDFPWKYFCRRRHETANELFSTLNEALTFIDNNKPFALLGSFQFCSGWFGLGWELRLSSGADTHFGLNSVLRPDLSRGGKLFQRKSRYLFNETCWDQLRPKLATILASKRSKNCT